MRESPAISKAEYFSNTYSGDTFSLAGQGQAISSSEVLLGTSPGARKQLARLSPEVTHLLQAAAQMENWQMRIVKVFIADPNESLPLEKRILYAGPETTTELTDQELYFELDIKELLAKHNKERVTYRDKKAPVMNGVVQMLEPVRVKDLKMVVVDIAKF